MPWHGVTSYNPSHPVHIFSLALHDCLLVFARTRSCSVSPQTCSFPEMNCSCGINHTSRLLHISPILSLAASLFVLHMLSEGCCLVTVTLETALLAALLIVSPFLSTWLFCLGFSGNNPTTMRSDSERSKQPGSAGAGPLFGRRILCSLSDDDQFDHTSNMTTWSEAYDWDWAKAVGFCFCFFFCCFEWNMCIVFNFKIQPPHTPKQEILRKGCLNMYLIHQRYLI